MIDAVTTVPASRRFVVIATRDDGDGERIDAFDPRLTRSVTIHRTRTPVDDATAERFLRGARIAGQLNHPSVPCILAMGRDEDGHSFYATPERRGTALERWCDGEPRPSAARRLAAFAEIARVIAYAHARAVVHGALTAAAVEIGEVGEVRVGGWGQGPGDASAAAIAADVAALRDLLAVVLGADRDAVPELARLGGTASPSELADRIAEYLAGARNLELRTRMAAGHVAASREALAAGRRDDALLEARKALALTPHDEAAAAIVGRLLIELPDPLPPGAAAAIARSDQQVIQGMGAAVVFAFASFLIYVPIMVLQGVRDPRMVACIATMTALMLAWAIRWRRVGPHVFSWPSMLGAATVLTLYSRTLGPFINAPAEAALASMAVMFFPRRPPARVVLATFAIPVLGTWLLEWLGAVRSTTTVTGGELVITSAVVDLAPATTYFGLAFVGIVLVTVSGGFAGYLAAGHRRHTHRLVIQSWRIRQLAAPE